MNIKSKFYIYVYQKYLIQIGKKVGENLVGVPKVLAIDAGGTMTDTIIIDGEGHFTIGKARSTPTTNQSDSPTLWKTLLVTGT